MKGLIFIGNIVCESIQFDRKPSEFLILNKIRLQREAFSFNGFPQSLVICANYNVIIMLTNVFVFMKIFWGGLQ